jgi:hypothetical protein
VIEKEQQQPPGEEPEEILVRGANASSVPAPPPTSDAVAHPSAAERAPVKVRVSVGPTCQVLASFPKS